MIIMTNQKMQTKLKNNEHQTHHKSNQLKKNINAELKI